MNISIHAPSDCTRQDVAAFRTFVCAGDAINPKNLEHRIKRAFRLLFLRDTDGNLAGVAALKRPPLNYRIHVFGEARATVDVGAFELELGWVVVGQAYRGRRLPVRMVAELLPHGGKEFVFATTRADKRAMQYALSENGFLREGVPFPSDRADYSLVLYVRSSAELKP